MCSKHDIIHKQCQYVNFWKLLYYCIAMELMFSNQTLFRESKENNGFDVS